MSRVLFSFILLVFLILFSVLAFYRGRRVLLRGRIGFWGRLCWDVWLCRDGFSEGGHGGDLDAVGRYDGQRGSQNVVDVIDGGRADSLRGNQRDAAADVLLHGVANAVAVEQPQSVPYEFFAQIAVERDLFRVSLQRFFLGLCPEQVGDHAADGLFLRARLRCRVESGCGGKRRFGGELAVRVIVEADPRAVGLGQDEHFIQETVGAGLGLSIGGLRGETPRRVVFERGGFTSRDGGNELVAMVVGHRGIFAVLEFGEHVPGGIVAVGFQDGRGLCVGHGDDLLGGRGLSLGDGQQLSARIIGVGLRLVVPGAA